MAESKILKSKPRLGFWTLWNISFGFFGVQIAYALQSANVSRIFATLGADPHTLSYFWILPPLAGIIVQPIVGSMSDRTWTRFGRRIPYLFVGSLVAVIVMCLMPNAGSFTHYMNAMLFGVISLMLLDTSVNMAMQPYKMLVGDMVNEEQKGLAYSIQSFLCNAGSLVGYLFPFLFAMWGIQNTAAPGIVPDTVIYSFYIGAVILILCGIYTVVKVKEMPPKQFEEFHGITAEEKKEKSDFISLLLHAPKVFWTVGLVQFFPGRHLCICGPIQTVRLPTMYGVRAIHRLRVIRKPVTGWAFYLPYRRSVLYAGRCCCLCSNRAKWVIR